MSTSKKGMQYLLVLGIILLAIVLRLPHLDEKEQGTDEKLSVRNAEVIRRSASLSDAVVKVVNFQKTFPNEVNPPLFFVLLSGGLFFSDTLLVLRLLVVVIGVVSVGVFYLFARKIVSQSLALFAAFLYAINPMHIIFSQHLRAYILLFLWFNLALYFLYQFVVEKREWSLVYLVIVYVLAVYTHYYAFLFMLGAGICVFLMYGYDRKIKLLRFCGANLVAGVLALPALLLVKAQQGHLYSGSINLVTPEVIFYPVYKFSVMADVSTAIGNFPALLMLFPLLLGLGFYGLVRMWRQEREKGIFLAANFGVPYLFLTGVGFFFPVYSFRYLTFLLPLFLLLAGYGVWGMKGMLRMLVLLLIVVGWMAVVVYYYSIVTMYQWPLHIAI